MKRLLSCIICICLILCGCDTPMKVTSSEFLPKLDVPEISAEVEDFAKNSLESTFAGEFLYEDICFETENVSNGTEYAFVGDVAGAFCVTDRSVIYSKNLYNKVYPASTTKLLTCLTAFKYGDLNAVYTVKEDNCGVTTPGAQLCGFSRGDTLTLEQLLYCLMIHSGNDAAVAVAECVSGSVSSFVEKMNREAARIGAKDTHMSNPSGLHAVDHYTTAFDIYLIFHECLKNKELTKIISTKEYTCTFKDITGSEKVMPMTATNQYFSGKKKAPEGITVLAGKTGVTAAAGYCLIILSEDTKGKQYITCVFHSNSYDTLYNDMNELLKLCK